MRRAHSLWGCSTITAAYGGPGPANSPGGPPGSIVSPSAPGAGSIRHTSPLGELKGKEHDTMGATNGDGSMHVDPNDPKTYQCWAGRWAFFGGAWVGIEPCPQEPIHAIGTELPGQLPVLL